MTNTLIITLLVATGVGGGVIFLLNGPKQASLGQSEAEHAPKADYVIELRVDGYYPKTLTIQGGDTVKFITTRGSYFWPASNLHPSHRIYFEFDPKGPVAAGDSWIFTFKKSGNWRYHDHLSPYFTGMIEVVE